MEIERCQNWQQRWEDLTRKRVELITTGECTRKHLYKHQRWCKRESGSGEVEKHVHWECGRDEDPTKERKRFVQQCDDDQWTPTWWWSRLRKHWSSRTRKLRARLAIEHHWRRPMSRWPKTNRQQIAHRVMMTRWRNPASQKETRGAWVWYGDLLEAEHWRGSRQGGKLVVAKKSL